MTELEMKIIEKIRTDPVAMERAVDFLQRVNAGESSKSILSSYGIEWEGSE